MNQILLRPRAVARLLGLVALALVLASIAGQIATYLTQNVYAYRASLMFNVDMEGNFPAAFSALLLLFAALLLAVITVLEKNRSGADAFYWAILSGGFFFMAFDESFEFHEKLMPVTRDLLGLDGSGIFFFAWVIPGMALVVVLGVVFARFVLRLSSPTRVSFLVAAALYLGGALGVELVGGLVVEHYGLHSIAFSVVTTIEESLEMAGAIVFIWALMMHMATSYQEVAFRFGNSVDGLEGSN